MYATKTAYSFVTLNNIYHLTNLNFSMDFDVTLGQHANLCPHVNALIELTIMGELEFSLKKILEQKQRTSSTLARL